MKCWICYKNIQDYVLLPANISDEDTTYDNNINQNEIKLQKDTFEIKKIGKFTFLYYLLCFECMEPYLKYKNGILRILRKREITGK
jgi:hypothetical protein